MFEDAHLDASYEDRFFTPEFDDVDTSGYDRFGYGDAELDTLSGIRSLDWGDDDYDGPDDDSDIPDDFASYGNENDFFGKGV